MAKSLRWYSTRWGVAISTSALFERSQYNHDVSPMFTISYRNESWCFRLAASALVYPGDKIAVAPINTTPTSNATDNLSRSCEWN